METIRTNLTNNASTQYSNFNSTSMCNFNGVIIGAGAGGLFKLCCGDDDNGVEIDASFTFNKSDLGVRNNKRMIYAYIGLQSDDDLNIIVTADNKISDTFLIPVTAATNTVKVPIGRGGKWGRYWTFKVENIDGCNFSIYDIKILPTIFSH